MDKSFITDFHTTIGDTGKAYTAVWVNHEKGLYLFYLKLTFINIVRFACKHTTVFLHDVDM